MMQVTYLPSGGASPFALRSSAGKNRIPQPFALTNFRRSFCPKSCELFDLVWMIVVEYDVLDRVVCSAR